MLYPFRILLLILIREVLLAVKQTGKPVSKNYFISKLKDNGKTKDFFFTGLDRDTKYFIHDNVAKPVWKIDETKTKRFLDMIA
jgi:hypothetical protein